MRSSAAIAATLATLAIGLLGGLWLSASLLDAAAMPGTVHAGGWKSWPRAGAPDADPYARALHARRGDVPLAPAEGLALHADSDSEGRPLTAACAYQLVGPMPQARIWTLAAYLPDGSLPKNPSGRVAFTSAEAVGGGDAGVWIAREPRPGNWLPLGAADRFVVALRLYDSPLASVTAALDGARLPRLQRMECRS
jgi:hypothetical protein